MPNHKVLIFFPFQPQNTKGSKKNFIKKYNYGIWFRANPKSKRQLKNFANQKFPSFKRVFFYHDALPSNQKNIISKASKIVFVYADCIGLNCFEKEKIILNLINPTCRLVGLNGRNRIFKNLKKEFLKLRILRILEKTLFCEILFSLVLFIISPILICIDFFKKND